MMTEEEIKKIKTFNNTKRNIETFQLRFENSKPVFPPAFAEGIPGAAAGVACSDNEIESNPATIAGFQ
jgi:hypothetical protein